MRTKRVIGANDQTGQFDMGRNANQIMHFS